MKRISAAVLALVLFGVPHFAKADTFQPGVHGLVSFEIENDWNFDSDDEDSEINDLNATVEPYFIISLTDRLAIETTLVFEEVQDPDAGEDSYFDNHGLYAEQLQLTYTGDNYSVFAGKIHPTFGTAWDITPGIYGTDFAEDYELSEKIGLGGSYSLGNDEAGEYTLTASTYFADTSILSDSTITRRGRLHESDGGAGNTEDLSSFSATFDAENPGGFKGLNLNVGYRSQAEGDADVGADREEAYALGANYTFPLSEAVEATALAEWVGIQNLDGGDDDVNYLTTGIGLTLYENWNVAASYTGRDTDAGTGGDTDDYLYQFSAGYQFDNGISVDVGYSAREESDVQTDTAGVLLGYTYEF